MPPLSPSRREAIDSDLSNLHRPGFGRGDATMCDMARFSRKTQPEPTDTTAEPVAAPAASPDAAPEPNADTSTPTPKSAIAPAYDYDKGF